MTSPAERLTHVRWIAGGTAAGKSALARVLAERHGLAVYDGDRAEHAWLSRTDPRRHPHLTAARNRPPGANWRGRTAEEVFSTMASLHGETVGFLVEDLLALAADRVTVVDYFGILPRHLAPLLLDRSHAVFLLPTPQFRRAALTARYADPARARATWGDQDPAATLAKRLARDALWDQEVRMQAGRIGLTTVEIDGGEPVTALADRVESAFGLPRR
ncbi:hypothetical protein [Actinacidiphila acidipaludis]|uniref:Dephospho-CoA kinase n=1 Tax=Actinacidiphila acidipaludis TaxID=2873382 RepID=A0ABS7QBH6_9ACTN|nr:hypothetical protein [Streptomyces acidipaludis]MBY8880535.1 hypothetical protein [Streptomyces acidipaludis]